MTTGKPNARFLPTLTEVVQLQPSQVPTAQVASDDAQAQLTRQAMDLLQSHMEQRLQTLLQAQAQNLLLALRAEMQQAVADAVQQALLQASNSQLPLGE